MGKRGPKSRITEETLDRIRTLYSQGLSLNAISKEIGCSEKHISRIIDARKIPKRERKVTTAMTGEQEEHLKQFLLQIDPSCGNWTRLGPHWTYSTLKIVLMNYAADNGIHCEFTYSWRCHFIRRHQELLELPIGKLFCMTQKKTKKKPVDTPTPPRHQPTMFERALRETMRIFTRAGLSKEKINNLLLKMKVAGDIEMPTAPAITIAPAPQDVLSACVSSVLQSSEIITPEGFAELMKGVLLSDSTDEVRPLVLSKKKRPSRHSYKTPEQLKILEALFAERGAVGRKRAEELAVQLGLSTTQVIRWFHHKRQSQAKSVKNLCQDMPSAV